ncbi:alpha/beta hydrolase-fold protein [Microbacterium mitrae]|nr:alpha/beta hydrolase-fold protein [Microbacterium mitrae]
MPMSRSRRAVLSAAGALALTLSVLAVPAAATAAEGGEIMMAQAPDTAAGAVDFAIYTPPGYAESEERYPTLYLLHGRGDTMAAWQQVKGDLDQMITDGEIAPMIVVMPDSPWSSRGNWYTDSLYTGDQGAGAAVETALAIDLVDYVDDNYRTVDDRHARAVGGYSMGGAGALRFALAHQQTFSAGLILSPAAYQGAPPADSSAREYGAYGVGDALYDHARYEELSYETALASFDPAMPVHLYLGVGDDEWANPDPADAMHDLDMATHLVYSAARRTPGVTAELRVIDGGHDWGVWQSAFRDGVQDLNGYLRTTPPATWEAELLGTAGDDRASGIVELEDGGTIVAFTVADAFDGVAYAGGMDVIVQRRDADGAVLWNAPIATPANDRAYGVVPNGSGGFIVAGFTRSDNAGEPGSSDQIFAASLSGDGEQQWITRFGDPDAADRAYAVASDGAGGVYLAGYTGGAAVTPSTGDKDVLLVRIGEDGEVLWADQFGSTGEDKGQGVSLAPDGGAYVTGIAGNALPGVTSAGGVDAYVAKYSPTGEREWLTQFGTAETDQAWAAVTREGGVYVVGHTKGALGDANLGDHDMYVAAFDEAGTREWATQFGTTTDDRAIGGVLGADGGLMVVGVSYGAMVESLGGVDIVTAEISSTGTVGALTQFGSFERDGADEWDDPNLFAASGSVWISGLTYGAPTGTTNAGSGDVFIAHLPYDSAETDGGGGGPTPTTPGTPSGEPGGGDGADGAASGGGTSGGLASTGAVMVPAFSILATLAIALGVIMRRRHRGTLTH